MPYTKQTWIDEVPASTPVKYSITGDVEGAISASAEIAVVTTITTTGSPVNATRLNYIEEGIETAQETAETALLIENAIGAIINRLTLQSISNSSNTAISFTTESLDTNSFWDVGTPTRIELPYDGLYLISIQLNWASNATGVRTIRIRKNGTSTDEETQTIVPLSGAATIQNLSTLLEMQATDYFELIVQQSSGGALDVNAKIRIGLLGKT